MRLIDSLEQADWDTETVITIGAFDGIHRGHQTLIRQLLHTARQVGCLGGVLTFHPHPQVVLYPDRPFAYLTSPGEKVALLERLGVDLIVLLAFTPELAALSAEEFLHDLRAHLKVRQLWVGPDFALGRGREGNVEVLRRLGESLGVDVRVIDPVLDHGEPISSTRIRRLIQRGEVGEAARLLGRFHALSGEVLKGAQRGRCLGFPTANLAVRPDRVTPADGVYAVFAHYGEQVYPAVANLGIRPTFERGERLLEVHLLDFEGDLYGCDLMVEFVARLRAERRFTRVEDLKAQIEEDIRRAREVLARARQALDRQREMSLLLPPEAVARL